MESAYLASLQKGRRLLQWGVAIYTVVAVLPLLGLLFEFWHWMLLPHSYWFLIIAFSPWSTLRGSNTARTMAGVTALFGALITFPLMFGILFPDGMTVGVVAAVLFPVACFLANVFLINKDVQTYVTSVRVARGLSANHWEIETRNS